MLVIWASYELVEISFLRYDDVWWWCWVVLVVITGGVIIFRGPGGASSVSS